MKMSVYVLAAALAFGAAAAYAAGGREALQRLSASQSSAAGLLGQMK